MHQLIYVSTAMTPLSQEALAALLSQSRFYNEQVGITGVLLYGNEQFMQVLEGEIAALRDVYERLLRDMRHHTITRLSYHPVAKRHFPQWSMAFHAIPPERMKRLRGFLTPEALEVCQLGLDKTDELMLEMMQQMMLQVAP